MIESSAKIGTRNAAFAKTYLEMEEIAVVAEDVGDKYPRKVRYFPVSGKAQIRKLQREDDYKNVRREEEKYRANVDKPKDDVELF